MFKFMQKKNDVIQEDVNMMVDNAVCNVKDQIDSIVTEMAYARTADIMDGHNLNDDEDYDAIHDEIFSEIFDSIYNELGIY